MNALDTCLTLLSNQDFLVQRARDEGETIVRIRYDRESYDWDSDYPVDKQSTNPEGHSTFELHFSLSEKEQASFYEHTGSRLNDVLPIQLQFGPSAYASFKVLKQGIGGTALSKKVQAISQFVAATVDYVYIPAIRRADTSIDLINGLVRRALSELEQNPRYVEILGRH